VRARNCAKGSAAGGVQALEMGTPHSFRGIGVDYPSSEDDMIDIEEAKRILAAFEREGVEYVMIGSMAMAAQGLVRATRDIDFFVLATAANVGRLCRALKSLYDDDPNVDQIRAEDLAGDYPAIEYVPPGAPYSLDLLSRLGEAFRYDTIESEDLVLDGIRIRVATPAMLYRMKKDTVRPQDRLDAEHLRILFKLEEK
jgi:hypothetical protein